MITVESTIHFKRRGKTKRIQAGEKPKVPGRIPRVARLMALAIRFQTLIEAGDVSDYAELARLAHVSRARITQIMNLLLLASDIQEAILFLEPVEKGRDTIKLRQLQKVALEADWNEQRRIWKRQGTSV
ncbi:MAG: hypothetical protein ACTHK7_16050 [Aureliella sp.]